MEVETAPPLAATAPDTSTVFCTACQLEIVGLQARREHYRSDLHRVNLKRKVAGLGPLTPTEFATRVAHLEVAKAEQAAVDRSSRRARRAASGAFVCEPCAKRFSSQKALDNHRASRRCQERLRRVARAGLDEAASELSASVNGDAVDLRRRTDEGDGDGEEVMTEAGDDEMEDDDEDDEDIDDDDAMAEALDAELARRLASWDAATAHRRSAFDDAVLDSPDAALDYMRREFGFFVPFRERLVDAAGLVRYVAQKVCVGFACIACDKGFASADDAVRHMRDVGHCRLPEEHDVFVEEFAEFYDFGAGARGDAADGDDDDGEGWEEVDETDVDENAVVVSGAMSNALVAVGEVRDVPVGPLDLGDGDDGGADDTVGLSVGGGKVVGHRSLARYYRQAGGRRADERAAVLANRGRADLGLAKYRTLDPNVKVNTVAGRAVRRAMRRNQRFELLVGQQNYYVRKSRFKQSFAVFNSGYRA